VPDVFIRDHVYGRTSRVSVRDGGSGSGNGESEGPSISDDGRYVAFSSVADNLVDGDTNGHWDVFVRDRDTDATERVSVHSSGVEGDSDSLGAMISANGRYVAFSSYAGNLVDDDTNGDVDVFLHDRATGTTRRVSVDSAGRQVGADCYFGSISGDGRIIAFTSASDDLVEDDTNGRIDVFVRDRDLGMTERVSLRADGREADEFSEVPLRGRTTATDSPARSACRRSLRAASPSSARPSRSTSRTPAASGPTRSSSKDSSARRSTRASAATCS